MAKKLDIDVSKIPKPLRIVLAGLPSVLLVALMMFLVIMPRNEQIEKLKQEISAQEKKISKTQSMAGRLDDLKAENERLKSKLKELEEQLPEEREISSLLKQVEGLTLEAGLDILTWNPAARRNHPSGIIYEVPVSVNLTGSYHRLGHFFSSLTKLDRIVNISNISLGSPRYVGREVLLNVSFSAVTFAAIAEGGLSK
jgi:type IV pilus assembly protein PilO